MNNLTQSEKEFLIELIEQELDKIILDHPAANVSRMLVIIEKLKTDENN